MGPLEEADNRLHEWSLWVRTPDGQRISWAGSTPFGRLIVPDPVPPREAIDYERAAEVDRIIGSLPGRLKFFLKRHYLDHSPLIAKARRAHLTRDGYELKLTRVQIIFWRRLTSACQEGKYGQAAEIA